MNGNTKFCQSVKDKYKRVQWKYIKKIKNDILRSHDLNVPHRPVFQLRREAMPATADKKHVSSQLVVDFL